MNAGLKYTLFGLGAIGLGVGAYFAINAFSKPKGTTDEEKKKDDINDALKDVVGSGETTTQTKIASDPFPFKIDRGNNRGGSEGLNVAKYQLALNYLYNAGLNVDGKFGVAMRDATAKYLPFGMYFCNAATQMIKSDACDIKKEMYDYLLLQIIKKDGKDTKKFVSYVVNNTDFKNLLRKYKQ